MNKLLIKVSVPYPYAKVYALRLLVETALFPPTSVIFGATIKSDVTTKSDSEKPLWKINVDQVMFLCPIPFRTNDFKAEIRVLI